jgi:L-iditol 2-dehydrogenase
MTLSTTPACRLIFAKGPQIAIEEFDVPAPGPRQVLVQVTRSHVSAGSEMNFLRHGPAGYGLPAGSPERQPIGYMTVGRIAALGSAVEGFALGERVLTGGNHASHWLVNLDNPSSWLEKVPDEVPDDAAGFAVLGDVALHGVRRAGLQIDESVAVFGMGIVGQLTLQLARLSGTYPLIAIDLVDSRLAKARQSGASQVINAGREDVVQQIRTITGGVGAGIIFHCTQVASILQGLLESAADRGRIILTGSAPGTAQIGLQNELLRRELTIIGNYEAGMNVAHPYWQWTRQRNRRVCLRLLGSGGLHIAHLLTHVVPYTQAQQTFEMMLRGSDDWLGVVFKWD